MLRGSQLYNDLFPETLPAPRQRKGRSTELHARRNEAVADRYYFYGSFMDRRYAYDAVIKLLAEDFFLSVYTIPEIITANAARIQQLKREQTPVRELAKRWPQFSWSI